MASRTERLRDLKEDAKTIGAAQRAGETLPPTDLKSANLKRVAEKVRPVVEAKNLARSVQVIRLQRQRREVIRQSKIAEARSMAGAVAGGIAGGSGFAGGIASARTRAFTGIGVSLGEEFAGAGIAAGEERARLLEAEQREKAAQSSVFGGIVGATIGGFVGGPAGASAGYSLGSGITTIFG